MKLTAIDERTKHRLTGLIVLLAIAIIFLPAMLKKSNQRLTENIHVSVQLPPKPALPKVAMNEEKAVFKSVKMNKKPVAEPESQAGSLSDAQVPPVHLKIPKESPKLSSQSLPPKKNVSLSSSQGLVPSQAIASSPRANLAVDKPSSPKLSPPNFPSALSEAYTVQLASFSVQKNAQKLVRQLQQQGYKARYQAVATKNGPAVFKVTVGQLEDPADAKRLQRKLSETTKLQGFIVKQAIG